MLHTITMNLMKLRNAAKKMLRSILSAPMALWKTIRTWKPTILVHSSNWIKQTLQHLTARWSSSTRHAMNAWARAADYIRAITFVMPSPMLATGLSPGGNGGLLFWRGGSHKPHHSATDTQTHYRKVMAESAADPGTSDVPEEIGETPDQTTKRTFHRG